MAAYRVAPDQTHAGALALNSGMDQDLEYPGYNDFDIIFDRFSCISQPHPTPHAPCAVSYPVPVPIGC